MPRKPKRDFVDQKGLKDADVTALQQLSPPTRCRLTLPSWVTLF